MSRVSQSFAAFSLARRRWLHLALAGGLVSAVTWAWWRHPEIQATSKVEDWVPDFWGLQWDALGEKKIAMRNFQGRPLLLNFWATWCAPCVQELPLLNAFFQQCRMQGWQVLGLAVDNKQALSTFLQTTALDFPLALAGAQGISLSRSLGNLTGGLPFTLVVSDDGTVLYRKMGALSHQDLIHVQKLRTQQFSCDRG